MTHDVTVRQHRWLSNWIAECVCGWRAEALTPERVKRWAREHELDKVESIAPVEADRRILDEILGRANRPPPDDAA